MYWFAQVSDPHIVRLGVELILNWHFFLRCQLSSRSMSSCAHHSALFPLCLSRSFLLFTNSVEKGRWTYRENYHECLHTWRQFGSTCVGKNSASTVYTPKQILRNQDNLVSWRNLQERCAITQDRHCRTIGWHLYKKSHMFHFEYLRKKIMGW
jgi:hypothetical protein